MKLRKYQVDAVNEGVLCLKKNYFFLYPSIIVLPHKAGKYIIISEILNKINDRVIILQPSEKSLEQNYAKFISTGDNADILSESTKEGEFGNVIFATYISLVLARDEVRKLGIVKFIIDECDKFSVPETIIGLMQSLHAEHVLGFTATPFRLQTNIGLNGEWYSKFVMLTNKSKHMDFFRRIAHVVQIQELVSLGYWAKIEYDCVKLDTSDLEWDDFKSEYSRDSVETFFTNQHMDDIILSKIKEYSDRRAIMVVVPTTEISEALSKKVPNSASLNNILKNDDRDNIINSFKKGDIKVIFLKNVDFVEFDYPELDCLIYATPTASLPKWYEFLSIGLNTHINKKDFVVVDLVDCLERFGKIEDLTYRDNSGYRWETYGSGDRLLSSTSISNIFQKEILQYTMPFGKYKGCSLDALPEYYITWLLDNVNWNDTNRHLRYELNKLNYERAQRT
jgi:DNA repair protein RadD